MELWRRVFLAVAGVVALALTAFFLGYSLAGISPPAGSRRGDGAAGERFDVIRDAYDKIRSASVEPPGEGDLAHGAIRGMVDVLKDSKDPYALFYSPKGYRSFQELTTGRFSGIGVWLKTKRGRLEIVSVLPSTPALEAGVRRSDIIESIDGKAVEGLPIDEAVALIKGPEGTEVALEVERGGDRLSLSIEREPIEFPNVVSRYNDSQNLGYLRLFGFAHGAGRQVRNEVLEFKNDGVEGLVLDLRDNGGGLFSEAIDVASVFIENGQIVSYRHRSEPEVVYDARGDAFQNLPIVVLVNEGTASASEIVAGALQDRHRALVIGNRTYGKGSVQEVVPLRDASAVKLTTASYFTPSGRNIDGKGIKPDVEVAARAEVQRRRAVEILKGIVISATGGQG